VRRLQQILLYTLLGVAVIYAGDYLSMRFAIPGGRKTTDVIRVRPIMDIPQKGGRDELEALDPQNVTCSISLFPQMGMKPCWWVRRHQHPQIDM
jgi:hypothetical protein